MDPLGAGTDSYELNFVNCLMWVSGTELRSSGRIEVLLSSKPFLQPQLRSIGTCNIYESLKNNEQSLPGANENKLSSCIYIYSSSSAVTIVAVRQQLGLAMSYLRAVEAC